jgi:hypothetical protein
LSIASPSSLVILSVLCDVNLHFNPLLSISDLPLNSFNGI